MSPADTEWANNRGGVRERVDHDTMAIVGLRMELESARVAGPATNLGQNPPALAKPTTLGIMAVMNRRALFAQGWAAVVAWMALPVPLVVQASDPPAPPPAAGDGRVLLLRHARAPGTFDPPGFVLGDCRTQRNLSADGRAQARAIGQWFARHGPPVATVRSSPWCRCMDTAQLAWGRAEAWAPLGSPVGRTPAARQQQLQTLRDALQAAKAQGGLHVWVSHMFVQQDLAGDSTAAGEGLLIQADAGGAVRVLGVWSPAASNMAP